MQELVTITLAKAITFDTISVIPEGRVNFRATALTGYWVLNSAREHFGFAAVTAFADDTAFEVGAFKDTSLAWATGLYEIENREPLFVTVPDSNVVGEVPASKHAIGLAWKLARNGKIR